MSKYKVLTIAIAVKNNRIAKFGEKVDDSELTTNAAELIEAGALELIEEKKSTKNKNSDNKPSADKVDVVGATAVSSDADATAAEAKEDVKEDAHQKAPSAAEKAAEAAKK